MACLVLRPQRHYQRTKLVLGNKSTKLVLISSWRLDCARFIIYFAAVAGGSIVSCGSMGSVGFTKYNRRCESIKKQISQWHTWHCTDPREIAVPDCNRQARRLSTRDATSTSRAPTVSLRHLWTPSKLCKDLKIVGKPIFEILWARIWVFVTCVLEYSPRYHISIDFQCRRIWGT